MAARVMPAGDCTRSSRTVPDRTLILLMELNGSMSSLRVVHIELGQYLLGGGQQVLYLLRDLQARGVEQHVVCPRGSDMAREAAKLGVAVQAIPYRNEIDIGCAWRMVRVIRRLRPDVVHLHSRNGADSYGGLAGRLAKAPLIILHRRVDNPLHGLLSRLIMGPLCDHVIAISDGIRQAMLAGKVPAEKISLVYSVVDYDVYQVTRRPGMRQELGLPDDARVIGIVAQLIERKGHAYLFRAMPELLRRHPNLHVLVLGKGRLDQPLRALAADLGIADRVVFAGYRTDMPQVFQELDLLAHPALMEGLGVSILQAQSAGVPVVASAVGGIPEIITPGANGLLVPPADTPALAAAVLRLLDDDAFHRAVSDAGRRNVRERFRISAMGEGTLRVYAEQLSRKGRQPRGVGVSPAG